MRHVTASDGAELSSVKQRTIDSLLRQQGKETGRYVEERVQEIDKTQCQSQIF